MTRERRGLVLNLRTGGGGMENEVRKIENMSGKKSQCSVPDRDSYRQAV